MPDLRFEPAANYDHALWLAAGESGVDHEYWDIFHQRHETSPNTRRLILQSLGYDVSSFAALEQSRRARFESALTRPLPASAVVSETDGFILLTLPAGHSPAISLDIQLETGGTLPVATHTAQLSYSHNVLFYDRRWSVYRLPLPAELPLGYHTAHLALDTHPSSETRLAVCPDRAWFPERLAQGGRTAGFNVALYGLRSARNWGCGDFTDLKVLLSWATRDAGFSFVGLNPLHALHNRAPYNTSPYLPLSMYYKNLLYIDIEAVPEFTRSACARRLLASPRIARELESLRAAPFVEYTGVATLKRRFLKLLYREFRRSRAQNPGRARAFAAYCKREGDLLHKFALYCALDETLHREDPNRWTWRDWPTPYQSPDTPESLDFARANTRLVEFYKYIQFVIEEQLASAQQFALESGMSIGLYHDLAVATDSFGSDLWAHRNFYATGCRVGAPPDDFSPDGQDWGFPPPNKETHHASGYELFRESIRKIVRHGGALRIDHVMRLYRLFWIPDGLPPAQGAYVRDYASDLLHILALESVRSRNIVIGEDLGTVTDEMRSLFSRFGILSYRLFPFEKNYQTGAFKQSYEYPRQALVSSSTHDLPTLAGFWSGTDIDARRDAGLIDETAYQNQQSDRLREKQRMLDTLNSEDLLPPDYTRDARDIRALDGDLHNAVVAFLAQVPSVLLLLNQEDFTKEPDQQNLPGSTGQYPNWQRKMRLTVEELTQAPAKPYSAMFRHHLSRTARA